MVSGIYSILNKQNGKIYVGLAEDIQTRFRQHKSRLNRNVHGNPHLQNAWNKYGKDAFEFNILEPCEKSKLGENERWWINHFDSTNQSIGYNMQSGGREDFTLSDETRKKLSESHKGKKLSEKTKIKIGEALKGHDVSDETREKLSEQKLGEKNPMYGKPLSLEHTLKTSKSMSSTGIFRVCKKKDKCCSQGFLWVYRWHEDGKQKALRSVDLDKLKEKVLANGLEWREFDGKANAGY